jgi:protease-4
MKEFFKFMFASMLGFVLIMIICSLIFFGVIISLVSISSSDDTTLPDHSVLRLKLDRAVFDRGPKSPAFFDLGEGAFARHTGLDIILNNLEKAKTDPKIKGILLDISDIPAGISTISEIRNALADFKKSGKFIISYSEVYSQSSYYLASVSDEVCLHPQGILFFKGLNADMVFLKGALDKLDIKMQIIRHGKFKAATEPLFLDKMSPENRQQMTALLSAVWNRILQGISESRGISVTRLNQLADSLTAQGPEIALKSHLVDKLLYKDELIRELRQKLNITEKETISYVSLEKYDKVPDLHKKTGDGKNRIAIIYATGDIGGGEGDDQTIGSERITRAIRKAREDEHVKAIVLRVNSPGGSSLSSDVIWREVVLAAKEKPVVASFGDVAASGGYYIACGATRIVAEPTTITGSIGVFAVVPNIKGLMNNKLGITFDNAKTNANSDFISINGPLPAYQSMILQREIENIYSAFVSRVAEGRHLTPDRVDSIGQGRVWSGTDAMKIGLIDDFGGIDKAVETAAGLAKIKDYRIVSLPEQKDMLEELIGQFLGDREESILEKELGENYKYFRYLKEIQGMKGIQTRLPFEISIN